MENVTLEKIVFTNISYNLNVESVTEFHLELKNEISLKTHKDETNNSFLLVFETSVFDPENDYINIKIKANAFFECSEKLSFYDDVVKDICFPIVFKEISEKIDKILEILDYPKLHMTYNDSNNN